MIYRLWKSESAAGSRLIKEDAHLNVVRGAAIKEIKNWLRRSDMPSVRFTPGFSALLERADVFNFDSAGYSRTIEGEIVITTQDPDGVTINVSII